VLADGGTKQREKELGIAGGKRKAEAPAEALAGVDLAAATKRTVEVRLGFRV